VGIHPDRIYRLTRDDLLYGNRGLIDAAIGLLRMQPVRRLALSLAPDRIEVLTRNVDWIDATLGGRALRAREVIDDQARIDLAELSGQRQGILEVVGMQQDRPVVRARIEVR